MNISEEIQKLKELHDSGALSDDEFAQAKAEVIGNPENVKPQGDPTNAMQSSSDESLLGASKAQSDKQVIAAHHSQMNNCPHCGGGNISKVRGLQGIGEVLFGLFLLFISFGLGLELIGDYSIVSSISIGVLYYIYIESIPYCNSCGKRTNVPKFFSFGRRK